MNFTHAIANTRFEELLRPKQVGEVVPSHVLPHTREPRPDFEAMQRALQNNAQEKTPQPSKQHDGG